MLNALSNLLGVFSILGLINAAAWLATWNIGMTMVSIAIFFGCGFLCLYLDLLREQIGGRS